MVKTRLIVHGQVQNVGYRALVKTVARNLGIRGRVRNMKDNSVEILCDCEDSVLEKFLSAIDIKGNPENPFTVNVVSIDIYHDGEEGYYWPENGFEGFEIDYGMELSNFERESLERSEIGALILLDVRDEVKGSRKDIKHVSQKVEESIEATKEVGKKVEESIEATREVRKSVDEFRNETIGAFDELDDKYHVVSENLERMNKNIEKAIDEFHRLVDEFIKMKKA